MKTFQFLPKILLLFAILIGGIACTNGNAEDEESMSQINNDMTQGVWIISQFEDSGKDETSDFQGYDFTFSTTGTLTATKGTTTYVGSWSVTDFDVDEDNPGDLDFNIFFDLSNQFEDLNEDWDINSHTSTKIELFDTGGDDEDSDFLTFQRK